MAGSRNPARTRIEVIGVGRGGGGTIDRVASAAVAGVERVAVDTDLQALERCRADVKVGIGRDLTHGLGAGGDWTRGRDAADENRGVLRRLVEGADMVFVTAGMGGGTGTGASVVLAEVAKAAGALTIGVVTRPFRFEGRVRNETAGAGISQLRERMDALIVIPNDRVSQVVERRTTLEDAFRIVDDLLRQGVQSITDLVVNPGVIDLDLASVRALMSDTGEALIGIGFGSGAGRAEIAARQAVASPLLEASLDGAQAVLFNVTAGTDLHLHECETVARIVKDAAHPNARIMFGTVPDVRMRGEMRVTVVATLLHRRLPPGQEPWPSGVPAGPRPRAGGEGAMARPPAAWG